MTADHRNWRSPALGEARDIELPQGTVRVFEAGSGATVVFAHGLLVNANLWRKVVPRLGADFHCLAIDLPLGSHLRPMRPEADLSPPGVAELLADCLERLQLNDVTVVGNDTGGAICQMLAARRPERIARLVLTSCDAFENFPPKLFRYLKAVARIPGATPLLFAPMRLRGPRRLPIAYGWTTKRPIDREAEDSYVLPALSSAAIRRDLRRFIPAMDPRHTLEAADRLRSFERPALIAWSREDRFFPPSDAERLARTLPNARLEWIEDARTFSPEDRPERVAELIAAFVREPTPQPS